VSATPRRRPGGPAPQADALAGAARVAYTDAMNQASLVGAAIALTAALIAVALLPARPTGPLRHQVRDRQHRNGTA
jgi:hypothetical protein